MVNLTICLWFFLKPRAVATPGAELCATIAIDGYFARHLVYCEKIKLGKQ